MHYRTAPKAESHCKAQRSLAFIRPRRKATISDEGRSSVLAICYHNMAIELEHLKEYEKARACHAEAVKV